VTPSAVRPAPARPAARRLPRPSGRTALTAGALLAAAAIAAVFPLAFPNPLATTYGFDTLIFVAAASAWNIFSGYTGYLCLGQAVFFGSGVYTVAIGARAWQLTGDAVFGLLPLAAVVAAAIAAASGSRPNTASPVSCQLRAPMATV